MSTENFSTLRYELAAPGVARVVMDRPSHRNAQNVQMSYELSEAFDRAVQDDEVKVIVLAASDPHFSAGHDLSGDGAVRLGETQPAIGTWGGFKKPGVEGRYAREQEIFLQNTRRWRNLSKPTIAAVQGKCIAGGLMLAWICDLIVASDDAVFSDPTVAMGVCGVEWFAHPWELGPRKAKEFLFTADSWTAEEAHRLGMVNRVVPRAELQDHVLALAQQIARKPAFSLQITKQAVNSAVDQMGQQQAIDQAFVLHQLGHANNMLKFGSIIDPSGMPSAIKKSVY
ncbi:enoyl-CoA hydratase [Hydrogenophaga sp. BPS33]|uniref:enoyl-CoA hydratase n=1 Tax=Hydrogenophaga sp. BPS33 TaxID=2651974 RepID=UPI00131F5F65|nr:enoyl-CoA hydratase [Hydrogenophaga sp. BPS33]QHE87524.1 enoyl-CoA hydratase [Hydrogenophaga sp. BPS33]